MQRREFLAGAVSASVMGAVGGVDGLGAETAGGAAGAKSETAAGEAASRLRPMAVGLIIQPANGAEAAFAKVHDLGMTNCFLSLDGYLGKFTPALAQELGGLLEKYGLVADSSGSGASGAAGVGFSAWAVDHWVGAAGDAGGADGRAEADVGFCGAAEDRSRADALRVYS